MVPSARCSSTCTASVVAGTRAYTVAHVPATSGFDTAAGSTPSRPGTVTRTSVKTGARTTASSCSATSARRCGLSTRMAWPSVASSDSWAPWPMATTCRSPRWAAAAMTPRSSPTCPSVSSTVTRRVAAGPMALTTWVRAAASSVPPRAVVARKRRASSWRRPWPAGNDASAARASSLPRSSSIWSSNTNAATRSASPSRSTRRAARSLASVCCHPSIEPERSTTTTSSTGPPTTSRPVTTGTATVASWANRSSPGSRGRPSGASGVSRATAGSVWSTSRSNSNVTAAPEATVVDRSMSRATGPGCSELRDAVGRPLNQVRRPTCAVVGPLTAP